MKFLIALLFFNLNLAYALDLSSTSNTKYEILNSYFVNAQEPSFQDIKGWWSGRCYRKNKPQTAVGSRLVVSLSTGPYHPTPPYHPIPDEDGPMFPHTLIKHEYNMMVFEVPAAPANFVDFSNNGLTESLEGYTLSPQYNQFKAEHHEKSIVSKNEPGNALMSVRKHDRYLLAQVANLHSDSNYIAGDVFSNCYYFKKIKQVE
jgi:hypothetical protein